MSKSTRKLIQTCKLICTILLVVVIGLQFIPYWYAEFTEKDSKLLSEEQYLIRQKELADEAAAKEDPTTAPTTEAPTTEAPTTEAPTEESTEAPSEGESEAPTEESTAAPSVPQLQIETYAPEMEEEDIPKLMKISIAKYVWMFRVNRVNENIFMPVLVLIFALASIITYVKNTYSVACSIWGVLAPAVGLYGFLTVPLFATGFPVAYTVNIVAHAVTLVATLATLIIRIVVLIQTIKKDRAERKAKGSFADQ